MRQTTDIEKYAATMKQIKLRTEVIRLFFRANATPIICQRPSRPIGLQFRKMFELIAFSSLAANREQYSAAYENFATHWRAGKLLENLERINPDFYPKPVLEVRSAQPGVVNDLKDRDQDYLKQAELIVAHRKCGALMHAENPFGQPIDYKYFEKNYPKWNTKIINLLNMHKVHLLGDTGFWLSTCR